MDILAYEQSKQSFETQVSRVPIKCIDELLSLSENICVWDKGGSACCLRILDRDSGTYKIIKIYVSKLNNLNELADLLIKLPVHPGFQEEFIYYVKGLQKQTNHVVSRRDIITPEVLGMFHTNQLLTSIDDAPLAVPNADKLFYIDGIAFGYQLDFIEGIPLNYNRLPNNIKPVVHRLVRNGIEIDYTGRNFIKTESGIYYLIDLTTRVHKVTT